MCVNSVFHKLNNSISSDLSTLFDYINLALSHSLDTYFVYYPLLLSTEIIFKFSWFNIELINLRQLLCRIQRKYAFSKFKSGLISFKVFDRFTRKNFSLPNRHTLLIYSVVMEYLLKSVYIIFHLSR